MANRYPDPALYVSGEWLALRETIVQRDGSCCRNCGSGERLEVHHWLPVRELQTQVDGRGYGRGENPLIVHESGLITLCALCHEAMTERRTRQAALRNPELLRMRGREKSWDNIFKLWDLNEKKLPFAVQKDTWNSNVAQHYRVEKIEIKKWPYGTAWGRYIREGIEGELVKIANAGTYTWRIASDAVPESPP